MSEPNHVKLELPLPDTIMSPNARPHHIPLAKAKKAHRTLARLEAQWTQGMRFESYRLHFFWPNRRRRDRDNAGTCCKAYLDGLSDACGQDDSEWEHNGIRFHLDKENPRVEIELEVAE